MLFRSTVIVTDSNENHDIPQTFTMPLGPSLVHVLSGTVGVHQYLIGKLAKDGKSFWFQTNSENPDRDILLTLECSHKPECRIEPPAASKECGWDENAKVLKLVLSHKQGAVEVMVQ